MRTISHNLRARLRYKHLHLLVMLNTSQNLHRASESLHMSQPAATRMLHEIEDMFGCDLFERLPRGMRPTTLGLELIRFAESALVGLDRCTEDLIARQAGGYGYLSIGTIMGAAPNLVMDTIADIKAHHPQLRIRIMGDTSDYVIRLLAQGSIDLAIARRSAITDQEHYDFERLGNERLLMVVRANHPLTRRKKLTLPELIKQWPWILQPGTSPARQGFDDALQRLALAPPVDMIECTSVYAMEQLLQLTNAIMVLSDTLVHSVPEMRSVAVLPISLDIQLAPFGLLRRKGEIPHREMRLFIAMLRKKYAQQAGATCAASQSMPISECA